MGRVHVSGKKSYSSGKCLANFFKCKLSWFFLVIKYIPGKWLTFWYNFICWKNWSDMPESLQYISHLLPSSTLHIKRDALPVFKLPNHTMYKRVPAILQIRSNNAIQLFLCRQFFFTWRIYSWVIILDLLLDNGVYQLRVDWMNYLLLERIIFYLVFVGACFLCLPKYDE